MRLFGLRPHISNIVIRLHCVQPSLNLFELQAANAAFSTNKLFIELWISFIASLILYLRSSNSYNINQSLINKTKQMIGTTLSSSDRHHLTHTPHTTYNHHSHAHRAHSRNKVYARTSHTVRRTRTCASACAHSHTNSLNITSV